MSFIKKLSPKTLIQKSIWTYEMYGLKGLILKALRFTTGIRFMSDEVDLNAQYQRWLIRNRSEKLPKLKYKGLFSVIMPVYNPDETLLREAIDSVLAQKYENWELCLVDDASPSPHVRKVLEEYKNKDKRIKVEYRKENGHISRSSNDAIKMAKGEFIFLVDNDDVITEDALYWYAHEIDLHPTADMIYSDEDKLLGEKFIDPWFKPDFSPDLIYSMMYPTHSMYRRSIVNKIGGFRVGYEGSQDYDLFLRFMEESKEIYHIPRILYHWRIIEGSTSASISGKSYAITSAKKALEDSIKRRKIKGKIVGDMYPFRLKRDILGNPKVSIIIPTKDKVDYLKTCINQILEITSYKNYEIIVVNNNSEKEETLDFFEAISKNKKVRVLDYDHKYNFSAINNYAAKHATGELVLFLNNDTKPVNSDWLSAMVEQGQRKEVGVVGPKLIYPSGFIQSAGLAVGLGGMVNSPFYRIPHNSLHYFNFLNLIRNCSAVTGACLMVNRKRFLKMGGFDEEMFPINYNDVDLSLRLLSEGYVNVYTPYAEVVHYESITRSKTPSTAEEMDFKKKWGNYIEHDPYYNANFSKTKLNYGLDG